MKKFTAIFLAIFLAFTLVACGEKEPEYDVEHEIETAIQAEAAVKCMFSYKNVSLALATCTTIDDNGDGTYNVYGYVNVTDDYGDKYKGNFDAVVSIDSSGDADVEKFELETPKKQ